MNINQNNQKIAGFSDIRSMFHRQMCISRPPKNINTFINVIYHKQSNINKLLPQVSHTQIPLIDQFPIYLSLYIYQGKLLRKNPACVHNLFVYRTRVRVYLGALAQITSDCAVYRSLKWQNVSSDNQARAG